MSANQNKFPSMVLGWPVCNFANAVTLALNSASNTTWLAMQVVPTQTKTLSAVKLFLDTKNGTPTTAGCTCDLFSDASGIPNASTEGPISADSIPASGNWMQWTFAGTSSLVAGTPYWFAFKNGTGTPGTNFPTYRFHGNSGSAILVPAQQQGIGGANIFYGWNKVHTVNSGTAWASSPAYAVAGLRLQYSDGTYEGSPIQNSVRPASGSTADRAFGTQEVGVRFSVPAGVTFNTITIGFPLIKTSTPGGLFFKLYQGATLLGTTWTIPAANVTATVGDWYYASFSSAQPIVSTNQPFRVTFGDATGADTNTKGYNSEVVTWENDANSLALKPMNGTLQKTITADNTANPVVFTDTSTDVLPFAMLLDTGGELTSAGGTSGGFVFGG